MTKHWKTTAIKDGELVNLYTVTTDRGIAVDLAAGVSGSLILATWPQRPASNLDNPDEDHIDLATGVFNQHAARNGYESISLDLVEVASFPSGDLKTFSIGGTKVAGLRLYAATVIEEPVSNSPAPGGDAQRSQWRQVLPTR